MVVPRWRVPGAGPILAACLFGSASCPAQEVLFVRGADRSGGFLEESSDTGRTEQLADIYNMSTSGGNHGWGELRQTLENNGFNVSQITETAENSSGPSNGVAVAFDDMDLSVYDVIVLGSNNAVYSESEIDAVENWIRSGGGALFISDANFGSDWADAPNSDQQFLDRFGLVMNQDAGTYSLRRSAGDFVQPDHPILVGVDEFDGEGVSPIVVDDSSLVVVGARSNTRVNVPPFGNNNQGQTRAVNEFDSALVAIDVDAGRIVGHFDRNTFFNLNGAGTDINRLDNRLYAIRLFNWLATSTDEVIFADEFEAQ